MAQWQKNQPANAGDMGLIPAFGRSPGEEKYQPTLVFLPGKFHGQELGGLQFMGP